MWGWEEGRSVSVNLLIRGGQTPAKATPGGIRWMGYCFCQRRASSTKRPQAELEGTVVPPRVAGDGARPLRSRQTTLTKPNGRAGTPESRLSHAARLPTGGITTKSLENQMLNIITVSPANEVIESERGDSGGPKIRNNNSHHRSPVSASLIQRKLVPWRSKMRKRQRSHRHRHLPILDTTLPNAANSRPNRDSEKAGESDERCSIRTLRAR